MKALTRSAGRRTRNWAAVAVALAAVGVLLVGIRVVNAPSTTTSSVGSERNAPPALQAASATPAPTPPTSSSTRPPTPPAGRGAATTARTAPHPQPSPSGRVSTGWHLTVYYTAVESFHHGTPAAVTGCLRSDCSRGSDDLGSYPGDFLDAVRNEGTGRITSGPNAGRYLDWSSDVGFWLDTIPATSWHTRLRPFTSSASGDGQLPRGARFQVVSTCGQISAAVDTQVCRLLQSKTWVVDDEFTPGLGGSRHADLYIGEEDRDDFENASSTFVDVEGASLRVSG